MSAAAFAARFRRRDSLVGYWIASDNPPAAERIARLGYDYLVLDGQHGLLDYRGLLSGLIAIDAAGGGPDGAVGLVRVEANTATAIGKALDAGAAGVIVPLIDSAGEAAAAVAASRYPPAGVRSFGPTRAALRIGPAPRDTDATVLVLAMIETAAGLDQVEAIAGAPGLDGLYVGPSDLSIGLGAEVPGDPALDEAFDAALRRILAACAEAGIVAGIYCPSGDVAAQRLAQGFSFVTVANDLSHLEQAAQAHLERAHLERAHLQRADLERTRRPE